MNLIESVKKVKYLFDTSAKIGKIKNQYESDIVA